MLWTGKLTYLISVSIYSLNQIYDVYSFLFNFSLIPIAKKSIVSKSTTGPVLTVLKRAISVH